MSAAARAAGTDGHVKGFRYYLSRPYVVVAKPVLVSECSVLYAVKPRPGEETARNGTGTDGEVVQLGRERTLRVDDASGAFRSVSEEELAALRALAERGDGVRQVGHVKKAPGPTVVVASAQVPRTLVRTDADLAAAAAGDAGVGRATTAADSLATAGDAADPKAAGEHLAVPTSTPEDRKTAALTGHIQVVFLPDLDEQYAVHNCNVLSKSAYALNFQEGWELTDVNGEFDSTAVPIEILNFIDSAIEAAKTVGLAGVARQAQLLGSGAGDVADARSAGVVFYRVVRATYLKPGVYRINKPWEIAQHTEVCGAGFLAKMGLATFETSRVEVVREDNMGELNHHQKGIAVPCPCTR